MTSTPAMPVAGASSPARGTWIEISAARRWADRDRVVPRKGDVDRNENRAHLRADHQVVPRKGDVDRNQLLLGPDDPLDGSSPARGTWIEMVWPTLPSLMPRVVPRKGDVDRNISVKTVLFLTKKSSPARGTWIEIRLQHDFVRVKMSSPARGTWIEMWITSACWPPATRSSPARGTWIEISRWVSCGLVALVVPRKGDVDRNMKVTLEDLQKIIVVPRKGDVDRNSVGNFRPRKAQVVVPRKGDVDRNRLAVLLRSSPECRPPQGGRG